MHGPQGVPRLAPVLAALTLGSVGLAGCVEIGDALADPGNPRVQVVTNYGTMTLELLPKHAPITVANFLNYTRAGFYDGLTFHRVIQGFVIQGGGEWQNRSEKQPLFPPIPLEISPLLTHRDGCLGMARGEDPNSATSQFYLCDGPQHRLDDLEYRNRTGLPGYAVFGRVVDGWPVLRSIAEAKTDSHDRPLRPITIHAVRVV